MSHQAIGGDPYLKFWDKHDRVLDEMLVHRYDPEELNKLLIGLGKKFDKTITWETKEVADKFFSSGGAPSDKANDEKSDL